MRKIGIFFGFMLIFSVGSIGEANAATADSVTYSVHGQDYGWQKQVDNGAMAGSTGKNKRLEAMKLNVVGDGGITYQLHGQDYGWQSWKKDGEIGGSIGTGKRVEALKIQLTGNIKNKYDILYRVHGQDYGWQNWKRNGELAGTTGQKKKIEAIEIRLVAKSPQVYYSVHGQDYGWQSQVADGITAGTIGKNKRMEALKINVVGGGGITYQLHGQDYGWQTWRSDGALGGTLGNKKQVEAIKIDLTGNLKQTHDIYYRVHGQDYGWQSWKKNTELAGTIGQKKKLEAIEVKLVEKPIPVTSISLNSSKNKIDMKIGESQIQLNTSILPSNSTDQRVRFISSNSAVAEVSNSGLVTGKSTGKTVITAETVDGKKTDTIEIEVLGRGQIFTKNTEIAWGSSWNYLDNIVKAVDEYGQPIPLNEITILGTVDTSKFGYQTVAFGHPKVSGFPPVTIKVLARKRDANKVRQEYLRLVNVERQKNGVNPISVNTLLEAGSAVRVDELVTKFSYVRPNGQPASTAISLSSGHSFRYGTLAYPVKLTNTGNDTDQELAKKLFDATYLGQTTDLNGNNTPNSIRFLDKDRETLGLAFKEIEGKECLGHVFIGGRYT